MTDHPKIKRHLTYLIIPFTYSESFQAIDSSLITIPFFKDKKVAKGKLYDHIASLIGTFNDHNLNKIGNVYELIHNNRTRLGLPNKKDTVITYRTSDMNIQMTLEDINLYLFDSQVGFLIYQIKVFGTDDASQEDIYDLVLGNYHLKKFHFHNNEMYFNKKISKDEAVRQTLDLEGLTNMLLEPVSVSTYFDQNDDKPNHALIYTAAYLENIQENADETLSKYLYYLRKTYKGSYLPTKGDLDIERNKDIYQPFENSYWGVSEEGLVNLSLETGKNDTDNFFQHNFFTNIERTYFYLYILLLHQKYSLLNMSVKAGTIIQELEGKSYAEQIDVISRFKQEVINFTVKGVYEHVSYITHQAELYNKIKDRLGIQALHSELKTELDALSSFIEVAHEKERQAREERKNEQREKNHLFFQVITLLFLPITVVSGFFGMNLAIINTIEEIFGDWSFGLAVTILYLLAGLVFYLYRKRQKMESG